MIYFFLHGAFWNIYKNGEHTTFYINVPNHLMNKKILFNSTLPTCRSYMMLVLVNPGNILQSISNYLQCTDNEIVICFISCFLFFFIFFTKQTSGSGEKCLQVTCLNKYKNVKAWSPTRAYFSHLSYNFRLFPWSQTCTQLWSVSIQRVCSKYTTLSLSGHGWGMYGTHMYG